MTQAAIANEIKPKYLGKKVTREEYLDLYDDGFKYDMIDGVLLMAPSPFYPHSSTQLKFSHILQQYLDKFPIGRAFLELDIFLPDGGDVLRPDISFVLKEKSSIIIGHIHGTPDLVCEILSSSTKDRDLGIKKDRYLKNGVKEYWVCDPESKKTLLYEHQSGQWEEKSGEKVESSLLKGFSIDQKELFS